MSEVSPLFYPRKVISASISGPLFAILFGVIHPNPFGERISSLPHYFNLFVGIVPIYMMFSFPVILIYGVLTSLVSDKLARLIAGKIKKEQTEVIISAGLHLAFGLIFKFTSLMATILFFVTDRLLQNTNKTFNKNHAIISLALPLSVWLIFMGVIWISELYFR